MYDIVYSEKAIEKLEDLESEIRERIVKKLDDIRDLLENLKFSRSHLRQALMIFQNIISNQSQT